MLWLVAPVIVTVVVTRVTGATTEVWITCRYTTFFTFHNSIYFKHCYRVRLLVHRQKRANQGPRCFYCVLVICDDRLAQNVYLQRH